MKRSDAFSSYHVLFKLDIRSNEIVLDKKTNDVLFEITEAVSRIRDLFSNVKISMILGNGEIGIGIVIVLIDDESGGFIEDRSGAAPTYSGPIYQNIGASRYSVADGQYYGNLVR